jgi:fructose-bisphosphate aldolase, class II
VTLVNTGELIDGQRFVLAANVILLEHAEAYVAAAEQLQAGLVLQLSENTVTYHGGLAPIGTAMIELARASAQGIAVHLDHATDRNLVRQAAALGFNSVMFDGSKLDYNENVRATRDLRAELGPEVWFEAELGEIGGKDGVHKPGVRTKPHEAVEFVNETKVDGLAVAVGSSHAMLTKSSELDFELIRQLAAAVPVPLVLHGSSGVSHADLKRAIEAGIKKLNIATELNQVFNQALSQNLTLGPGDPRKFLVPARAALTDHLIELHRGLSR